MIYASIAEWEVRLSPEILVGDRGIFGWGPGGGKV
jgi:hypothetical protein